MNTLLDTLLLLFLVAIGIWWATQLVRVTYRVFSGIYWTHDTEDEEKTNDAGD